MARFGVVLSVLLMVGPKRKKKEEKEEGGRGREKSKKEDRVGEKAKSGRRAIKQER